MTHRKKPPANPPFTEITVPFDSHGIVEHLLFNADFHNISEKVREGGGDPSDRAWQIFIWNEAKRLQLNRKKALGSAKGGERIKKRSVKAHKEIAEQLEAGQRVKSIQIDRETHAKKASSERTIRRVKKKAKSP